jgi:hypothetical protein
MSWYWWGNFAGSSCPLYLTCHRSWGGVHGFQDTGRSFQTSRYCMHRLLYKGRVEVVAVWTEHQLEQNKWQRPKASPTNSRTAREITFSLYSYVVLFPETRRTVWMCACLCVFIIYYCIAVVISTRSIRKLLGSSQHWGTFQIKSKFIGRVYWFADVIAGTVKW